MTEVTELTADELAAQLDREARARFGISGVEFAARWHAGAYQRDPDPRVTQTAMLLPDAW